MKTALRQGNYELSASYPLSRQPEGCIYLIPWDEEKVLSVLFHKPQALQDLHVVKDVAVLTMELLSQCIDTGMPHGVQDVDRACTVLRKHAFYTAQGTTPAPADGPDRMEVPCQGISQAGSYP